MMRAYLLQIFVSRFEKFKLDEISIDEAEDDICFNAKDSFEDSWMVSLIGLRFTEDENTGWLFCQQVFFSLYATFGEYKAKQQYSY